GWCAGWWDGRWRRSWWRFAGRTLHRRRSCGRLRGHFSTFFQPGVVVLRCINDDTALHTVMPETTQLPAYHLIRAGLNWLKPHWNDRTGNCVLRDAHIWQTKIVNHI